LILNDIYQTSNGDRQGVPNVAVVFSDGASNIQEDRTVPQAVVDRISGIHIISVAVGKSIDMVELRGIASFPSEQNVLTVDSFRDLMTLKDRVTTAMCDENDECRSNPCLNGGRCQDANRRFICECAIEYTGERCERRCRRQYDIALVLDLSGSVEEAYTTLSTFSRRFVQGLEFRFDRMRLALVTYADRGSVNFRLDSYTGSKEDILNALSFPRTGGRTNTQDALRLTRDEVFQSFAGDRNGIDNVVVLLTDGGSNVDRFLTVPTANDIKNRGNTIYVVAIGNSVDVTEVNNIASTPGNPHVLRMFSDSEIDSTVERLLNNLCQS
jgi:collagen type VI alpha